VALLAVILEDLLARRQFETFQALVPLLASSELAQREQRQLLAEIYLRGGFLASAAGEWMAVCQQAPDARAFIGLAHVAQAHGTPADAATFAAQALALEPGNEAALELVAKLTPAPGI
jgi:Tfp pilus assembly protein PilF